MPIHLCSGFTRKVEEQQLWLSHSERRAGAHAFHPTAWGLAHVGRRGLPCPALSIARSLFGLSMAGGASRAPTGITCEAAEQVALAFKEQQ